MKKSENGITLIALVITIVVLIILAGVAITFTIGDNGILKKSKVARDEYTNSADLEKQQVNTLDSQLVNITGSNVTNEKKELKYDATKLDSKIDIKNVNIDDYGIATLDKSDSYITINENFMPGSATWEVNTKFKVEAIKSNSQAIIGKSGAYNPTYVNVLATGVLNLYVSDNNTAWNVVRKQGTTTITPNIWYWIKLKYDGTSYKVLLSTNGNDYWEEIIENKTTVTYQQDKFVLGDNLYYPEKFYGQYDLKETYIKIEENYFFNGLNYFSEQ